MQIKQIIVICIGCFIIGCASAYLVTRGIIKGRANSAITELQNTLSGSIEANRLLEQSVRDYQSSNESLGEELRIAKSELDGIKRTTSGLEELENDLGNTSSKFGTLINEQSEYRRTTEAAVNELTKGFGQLQRQITECLGQID